MKIPLLIIGLVLLYIFLSIEPFNVVQEEIPKHIKVTKKELVIKPSLLKGLLPIAKPVKLTSNCPISQPKKGDLVPLRENVDKYIKQSMLLNKPNHNLGFLPANVRYMDLMFLKPNEIGKIPLFKGKIPEKINIPKLSSEEE